MIDEAAMMTVQAPNLDVRNLRSDPDSGAREILENAPEAFIAIDVNGQITDWNTQAATTFGW